MEGVPFNRIIYGCLIALLIAGRLISQKISMGGEGVGWAKEGRKRGSDVCTQLLI